LLAAQKPSDSVALYGRVKSAGYRAPALAVMRGWIHLDYEIAQSFHQIQRGD
jgi:hypothetical protein